MHSPDRTYRPRKLRPKFRQFGTL